MAIKTEMILINQNRTFQQRNFNQNATNINRTMTMDSDQMAGCIREVVGSPLQNSNLNASAQIFTPSSSQQSN